MLNYCSAQTLYDSSEPPCTKTVFHKSDNVLSNINVDRPHAPSNRPRPKTYKHSSDNTKDQLEPKIFLSKNPPKLDKDEWDALNKEFCDINKSSWSALRNCELTPEQYVSDLNGMLASFLLSKKEFNEKTKQFFKHAKSSDNIEDARVLKIELNKEAKKKTATTEVKVKAKEAIRFHSHLLKINKEKEKAARANSELRSYKTNFWKTAKLVTNGVFGEEESAPTFGKDTADQWYKEQYESAPEINLDDLSWFPSIEEPSKQYNMKPNTPKDIEMALLDKDKNSAPGFDGIVYEYILKVPYLHKVLATTFTKILHTGDKASLDRC